MRLLHVRPSRIVAVAAVLSLIGAPGVQLSAASQASLQAQADALAAQIASQSATIRSLALQEAQAKAQLAADQVALAADQHAVATSGQVLARAHQQLIDVALGAFTDSSGTSSVVTVLDTSENDVAAQAGFVQAAGAWVQGVISRYQRAFQVHEADVAHARAVVTAQTATASALAQEQSQLEAAVASEQQTLAQVKGQIQALVQAQLAAEAAAAAARAAAQAAAAQAAAAQAAAAQAAAAQAAQGAPSTPGLAQVVTTGVAGSRWGGTPAPPTAAAFAALRECESGGDYQANTGNGYYGAYQFAESTWLSLGETGLPSAAPPSVQDAAAAKEQQLAGWGAWPECSLVLGLD